MKRKTMRAHGACALAALFLLALLALATTVQANGGAGVRLSAERLNLGIGNETTVDILADGVPPVYGVDVRLTFDPTMLEVVDADAGTPGIQLEHGAFIAPARSYMLQNQADNQAGTVDYALALLNPAPPAQGSGVIARITFRAKADGWTTVSIEQALFGTQTGQTIPPLPVPVQAGFSASTTGGTAPLTVMFTNTSSGDYASSLWDFGDGATSSLENPTHTYNDKGLYPATLTIADTGGNESGALLVITIDNVAPAVDAGPDRTAGEGEELTITATFFDPDPLDTHTATFDWGDGAVTAGTIGDGTASGSHAYLDEGVHEVGVEVCDAEGGCGSDDLIVTVANVAPLVGEIAAPLDPLLVSSAISASAGFADPGVLDTHTALWDWDDGNTSAGTVDEANGSGTVSGDHTYTTPGVHIIRLTVTDNDGGVGESAFRYVVIYNPEGGFVTGGGWIQSPEGAYPDGPSLTGKANFGFVSKYQQGATVPTGQTQFHFKAGDLKFDAESYEWLVIFGARAWFQGIGTVNGGGGYKFLVTAVDGDIDAEDDIEEDRFRIKVWTEDENGTETIVYDNGFGSTDFGEDWATELGGGSIVIHHGK